MKMKCLAACLLLATLAGCGTYGKPFAYNPPKPAGTTSASQQHAGHAAQDATRQEGQ